MKCGIAILVTPVRTGSMFEQNARGVQGSYHGGRTPSLSVVRRTIDDGAMLKQNSQRFQLLAVNGPSQR
jgi:hypothetical protein